MNFKFKEGDSVKLVKERPSNLKILGTEYSDDEGHIWGKNFDNYLGKEAVVAECYESGGILKYTILFPENETYFYVREDWLQIPIDNKCICDIDKLMTSGCKCGQMEKERALNERVDNSYHYM